MICTSQHGRVVLATLICLGLTACGADDGPSIPMFEVTHHEASSRLHVNVYPGLEDGQSLYMRVRQGPVGVLECEQVFGDLERIDSVLLTSDDDKDSFEGLAVDPAIYDMQDPYDASWLELDDSGTPLRGHSDIAAVEATFHTIDLCLMNADGTLARGAEMDIQRALDVSGTGKFDGYGDANERIVSVTAYAQACIAQMGEIPFFPSISEGDYETFSCLDATPIPMTVTPANPVSCDDDISCVGSDERCTDEICVSYPEKNSVDPINGGPMCDNPQYIYSSCEPNAVSGRTNGPRVTNQANDQGTEWVLLCRKSQLTEGQYNDIAMLGTNPYTGVTCFFQNALYSRTDGLHVPHPADEVDSPQSPQQSTSLWSGIQGGIGSGIECVTCHDNDPIIHTPWIDGAKDANGDPVLPKMGIRDGFAEGFNEAPYSLVNLEGQGWTMPKHITSEGAAACTKCHRIGSGRWAKGWMKRMEGTDTRWTDLHTEHGMKFEHLYWMPPELEGIDEATWPESDFGKATDFIQNCVTLMDNEEESAAAGCRWEELPTEQVTYEGEPVTTDLQGKELALAALKALGANVGDSDDEGCDKETPDGQNNSCANQRCAECHSVGEGGLKHWLGLYKAAKSSCGLNTPIEGMDRNTALEIINCMRATPEDATSVFAAEKMGIMTTGARFGYFRQLFQLAYTEDQWLREYILFKSRVSMPKGTYSAFSEMEYAVVEKWFDSGLQHIDQLLISEPPPPPCPSFEDSEWASDVLASYIDEMKYDGWAAVNKEAGISMYGCENTTNATECFKGATDHTEAWGNGVGSLKEVLKLSFKTSFWTRSSADGRYIGNGGGHSGGATITDMVNNRDIKVKASYDPGFFPDNSGFIYQGGGTKICAQSSLETAEIIDFDTPGCMKGTNINLYQHVARGLNGGDYFIINSQFTSDSGRSATKDPVANFDSGSSMKFSPMIFNGTTYEQLSPDVEDSPFEGDSVLSPSTGLVISRQGGGENGSSLGYVIREVHAQKEGAGYNVTLGDQMARVCLPGAKANISYDERFFVTSLRAPRPSSRTSALMAGSTS
jgi:hypothetical protein